MKSIIKICVMALFSLAVPGISMQAVTDEPTVRTLRQKLSSEKSAADSLKVLYDIFDVSSRDSHKALAREMYGVAKRAGDVTAQLDIMRQVTAVLSKDEEYDALEKELATLPANPERRETELFLQMKRISYKSKYITEEERQKAIAAIIADKAWHDSSDKYSKLLNLFTLVEYLRNDASGDMLRKYLDDLYAQANSAAFTLYSIPNMIYAEAANAYTAAGDHAKAVEADRKLEEIIKGLEEKYARMGRAYRNYDVSRFVSYRRMLRNYEALRPGEAEQIMAHIRQLAASDSDVARDLEGNPLTMAFFYMSQGEYATAVPLLRTLYDKGNDISLKKQALEQIVRATEQTGDDATRLWALEQYKDILEEYSEMKAAERYREMQIIYDINTLRDNNSRLEIEARTREATNTRNMMWFVLASFIILAIALFASILYWSRFRRNTYRLGLISDRLNRERNRLRHEVFYEEGENELDKIKPDDKKVMSELKAKRKELIKRYGDVTSPMVLGIVNDLLLIAFMGKDNRRKNIQPASFDSILRGAAGKVDDMSAGKIHFSMRWPEEDFKITTDAECLSHVLGKIIHGMANHNTSGVMVSVDYARKDNGMISFIFTSPRDYTLHEDTFSYTHIISAEDMAGNERGGIFIDRLIGLLLASDIKADNSYQEGVRFMFTTPTNLDK